MRTMKFRAWIENAMCYDIAELEFKYFCIVVDDHPSGERGFSMDKAEIMQYTGLKDKKGKDIYEGDLLLVDERRMVEVYWFDVGSTWDTKFISDTLPNNHFNSMENQGWNIRAEVIGNIHERKD